jgi:hypothetical protein
MQYQTIKKIFLVSSLFCASCFEASAKKNVSLMPSKKIEIGPNPYTKLGFVKGNYKKLSGTDNCLEGEYRLLRDPKTGQVFLKVNDNIFINHIDQKVVNSNDQNCIFTYFNSINDQNELDNTEIQSCTKPTNVSSIRNLKIKFSESNIKYVCTFRDPTKNIFSKTECELNLQ